MYLSGALPKKAHPDVGIMWTPGMGNRFQERAYGIDNGRFVLPWNKRGWLRLLQSLYPHRATCLFAVVPDVVGDAMNTRAQWAQWAPRMKQYGYPLAFATQDGCSSGLVPWDELDVLFVGGSDHWKFSDASIALLVEAKERGKLTHQGRVNTWPRMRACVAMGFDTVDGTLLKYGPDVNWPRLCRLLEFANSGQVGMAI